jgi:Protein of Unknown function (DUF2784)
MMVNGTLQRMFAILDAQTQIPVQLQSTSDTTQRCGENAARPKQMRRPPAAAQKRWWKVGKVRCEGIMIWLADAVLVVHALLALFILGGLAAIWLGARLGWAWVRDRLFRLAHLFAIGLVSTLSLLGIACPLTALEDWLRHGALGSQGFIQRWVDRLLYYDVPASVFTLAYVAFALLVLLTWRRVPPRQRK